MERVVLSLPQTSKEATGTVTPLSCGLIFDRAAFCCNSSFIRQVPFLFWLIETIRPSSIVEIGVTDAVSYFAACQAVDRLGLDTLCQGIGFWNDGVIPQELRDYEAERYSGFSRLTAEDVSSAAVTLPEGSVDLLIIREPVDSSFLDSFESEWLGKLSPQSVILLSGTGAAPAGSTERLLHERLTAGRPSIDLQLIPRATAVLHGPQMAEQLRQVAQLRFGTRAYSDLCRLFARLGAAQQAEWFVISRAKEICWWRRQRSVSLKTGQRRSRWNLQSSKRPTIAGMPE
jgi:hypothetical protein